MRQLLERHAHGEDEIVVSGVEVSRRKLHACTERECDAIMNREPADYDPGRKKHLLVAVLRSALEEGGVHFRFRPQMLGHMVLKSSVEEHGASNLVRIVNWQAGTERTLHAGLSVAFAGREG